MQAYILSLIILNLKYWINYLDNKSYAEMQFNRIQEYITGEKKLNYIDKKQRKIENYS